MCDVEFTSSQGGSEVETTSGRVRTGTRECTNTRDVVQNGVSQVDCVVTVDDVLDKTPLWGYVQGEEMMEYTDGNYASDQNQHTSRSFVPSRR